MSNNLEKIFFRKLNLSIIRLFAYNTLFGFFSEQPSITNITAINIFNVFVNFQHYLCRDTWRENQHKQRAFPVVEHPLALFAIDLEMENREMNGIVNVRRINSSAQLVIRKIRVQERRVPEQCGKSGGNVQQNRVFNLLDQWADTPRSN